MTLQGEELLDALEKGEVRAAEPDGAGGWTSDKDLKLRLYGGLEEDEAERRKLQSGITCVGVGYWESLCIPPGRWQEDSDASQTL